MKSRLIQTVSAGFLCLCVLTVLSGCSLFDVNKMTEKMVRENQKRQNEKWRQFIEAQQQRQQSAQQQPSPPEQQKVRPAQMSEVTQPKDVKPSAVKEQEQQKVKPVVVVTEMRQESSEKESEADDLPPQDAYGSNDAATPSDFLRLPPEKKAALHWVAAQEYWNLHNTNLDRREAGIVANLHGTTTDEILKLMYYSDTPREVSFESLNALPHIPKRYEKWRAKTINKHYTSEGLIKAVATLDQAQKDEQLKKLLTSRRRGCEWTTGKYYIDRNPSALCTPVIGKCVEGDCDNGHGTYVSFDGSKFVGEFKNGNATKPDPIYISGKCLQGDCKNGNGTYAFSDGSKYVGDFKNGKPHGKGTKTWAIGQIYTGEFKDAVATGKGKYTPPARHNLSQATCIEGDCYNGQGVMMYQNDTKYVGQFAVGKPHGKGIYYWRTGEALEGWFVNGWLDRWGNHISPDGLITVTDQRRSWRQTYEEEEFAYRWEHKEELAIEAIGQFMEAEREVKEEYCGGRYHKPGTSDYSYCGQ